MRRRYSSRTARRGLLRKVPRKSRRKTRVYEEFAVNHRATTLSNVRQSCGATSRIPPAKEEIRALVPKRSFRSAVSSWFPDVSCLAREIFSRKMRRIRVSREILSPRFFFATRIAPSSRRLETCETKGKRRKRRRVKLLERRKCICYPRKVHVHEECQTSTKKSIRFHLPIFLTFFRKIIAFFLLRGKMQRRNST